MNAPHRYPMLWLLTGAVAMLVLFAYLSEIDRAVRAQGQVIPSSRTQVVQATDGGMLTALHVKEGDIVKSGQLLAELESDRAQAGYAQSEAEYASKRIALVRALSELVNRRPTYGVQDQKFPNFIDAQMGIYHQRKQSLEDEVFGLEKSKKLADDELAMHQRLYKSGDISLSEVIRAERQVIDAQTRINSTKNKYYDDSRKEVAKLEEELAISRYKRDDRQNILQHTDLLAPMDGVVKYVRINTLGGVLKPGDELMQISPVGDDLIIEVKVNPADVGYLRPGLLARVRFDAFDSAIYGNVIGKLTYVSPDTFSEQGSDGRSQVYYRAHVIIDWERTHSFYTIPIKSEDVKPGLIVTVDVITGKRSVLEFLFKPVMRAFTGAFIEK